jgi:hypothetical protein
MFFYAQAPEKFLACSLYLYHACTAGHRRNDIYTNTIKLGRCTIHDVGCSYICPYVGLIVTKRGHAHWLC